MQYLSTKSIILDVVDNWSDELSISNLILKCGG